MLTRLNYTVSTETLQELLNSLPSNEFRHTVNQPTGDFFYDPWEIKPEFKNSAWERLLSGLNLPLGEARVIHLKPGTCYHAHADIDDRYHLNLTGNYAYLVDLDSNKMHPLSADGYWYEMDAGRIHSAVNFGAETRIQLVVRKLLNRNQLRDPVRIKIFWTDLPYERARSMLDHDVSSWLSQANKSGEITNFSFTMTDVTFDVERASLDHVKSLLPTNFKIDYL